MRGVIPNRSRVDIEDPAVRARIARLYRDGLPTSALHERFGKMNTETMEAICAEHGVPMRTVRGRVR